MPPEEYPWYTIYVIIAGIVILSVVMTNIKLNSPPCNTPMQPNQGLIRPAECYGYNPCTQQGDLCSHLTGNTPDIRKLASENNCEYRQQYDNYTVNFTQPDGSVIWC